jgi:hypothetical protein
MVRADSSQFATISDVPFVLSKKILEQAKRLGGKGPGIRAPSLFMPLDAYFDLVRIIVWLRGGEYFESKEDVPDGELYINPWTGRQYINHNGQQMEYY